VDRQVQIVEERVALFEALASVGCGSFTLIIRSASAKTASALRRILAPATP
jgi:hypothetical protein